MKFKKLKLILLLSSLLLIGLGNSNVFAQAYTWNNVAIMGGGFISGIVASPAQSGLIYARTDVGGAYIWNNANSTWTPLTDMFPMSDGNYLGIESIAPDPSNANIVYAAAGMYLANGSGVILSSTNQGASWTVNNTIGVAMGGNENGRGMGERLAVDPNLGSVLFFGSRNNGLWESANSAASWTNITAFPANGDSTYGLSFVVIDGQGGTSGTASATIFVGVAAAAGSGSNLYESTNGGGSWAEVTDTGGPSGYFPRHASLGSDGNLWVAYGNDYGPGFVRGIGLLGQIWKYNISGNTWTNVTPSSNWGGNAGNVCVDAQDANHAIISTLDGYGPDKVLATANGGTSWSVIANPDSGYGAPYSQYNVNGAEYLYGFTDTYDAGNAVSEIGTNATNWVEALALDPFNSNRAFHGSGEGLFVSNNIEAASPPQSVLWTFDDSGLEETVPLYLPASTNGDFLSAVGDDGGMRNTSLTAPAAIGMYLNPRFSNTNSLDFAASNTNLVARAGNSGTALTTQDVAYSGDNGQTWTPWGSAPAGYNTTGKMQSVAVDADGTTVVVSPGNGYGSPAYAPWGGGAWAACGTIPSGSIVAADRVTPGLFYATSGTTLYYSTNGGQTFTAVGGATAGGAPRPVFGEAGEVWTAGGGTLYRFTGVGTTNTRTPITSVTACYGVGFGISAGGAPPAYHPAVYIVGIVGGQYGFFRSDDTGTTWTQVNDSGHQFGYLQNNYIGGDETVYGRVYLTTGGRGIIYGTLAGAASTATQTPTNTATNTPSNTATATSTDSPTQTPTNTPTSTSVVTNTSTGTMTNTAANTTTDTPTDTPTQTATDTATNTITGTIPSTDTATNTFTNTPTSTAANTTTNTMSATATGTATNSSTQTATDTTTATATRSPTGTATDSATQTATNTPTITPTHTATNTPSSTGTDTATLTPTRPFTATSTPTITPTYTATTTSSIIISEPFPNPSTGPPITFNVQVPAESKITLDVFTLAFRKIYSQAIQAAYGPQTFQWNLKDVSGIQAANGLYYVRIHVAGNPSAVKILKVLIVR